MGIVVLGAVFVDIKGYPSDLYIPGGRNSGRVEVVHGGVSRNLAEDIANVELRPTTPTISAPYRTEWEPGWRYSITVAMWPRPFPSAPTSPRFWIF